MASYWRNNPSTSWDDGNYYDEYYGEEEFYGEEEEYYGEEGEYYREEEEYNGEEEYEGEYDEEEEDGLLSSCLYYYTPSTWVDMYPEDTVVVKLYPHSREYKEVTAKILKTLTVKIDNVIRIQNPFLWGCYLLKKAEYEARIGSTVREKTLFHATGQNNIEYIAESNLDWRRSVRTKFGHGVSFSSVAKYANKHCSYKIGTKRALILAKVLIGLEHQGGYGVKVPKEGYDTTTGNSKLVYVKFCDNEFYPEYVAFYSL